MGYSSRRRTEIQATLALVVSLFIAIPAVIASPGDEQASAKFDGPAELPRKYVKTSLADTPAPGRVHHIKEGENLQKAIDDAKCGDTLELQAGATFAGIFRFPRKSCDDSHWIIVRTSAPNDALPPENTILTPCYAGVASLPGRPDFHCSAVKNVLAKMELDRKSEGGPVLFEDGANHYRFIGLEITRAMEGFHMRDLVQPEKPDDTADHLVFDRLWLHGTPQDETKGGIHLTGTTNVGIVDSFFTDFHCIALHGSCTDSQAINGGGGDHPMGPFKIVNNFLEGAAQSIMFGGAPGTQTPADIEIRHNHLFKPLLWKKDRPDFVGAADGSPFIVKNCFELKNAQRVLFEGNVLENVWGGFTQSGFAIILMPTNQGGNCPDCRVTDITLRFNRISHSGGALDMGNVLPKNQVPTAAGERYSIHDLVFDDIDMVAYKGLGSFAMVLSEAPPLNSVRIDHITAFPPRVLMTVLDRTDKLKDFSITNSIFTVGQQGMLGAGGGPTNCARNARDPNDVLNNCFANFVFKNNILIGGRGGWPKGNHEVGDADAVGLRDFHEGHGGDYRLCPKEAKAAGCKKPSPGFGAGTDGKDIGADIDAINRATEGVL
ncbi:MAG TPA: hypothetical protein VKQ11_01030 [Candidatus Sulfotelmatobacter sp.]|nr:hypothetical protein [Candidatus Sulfotelmatobacter sp.]